MQMAQPVHLPKPDRSHIDLSDCAVAKRWVKKLGKSKEEIAMAIAKVGGNVETVMKELCIRREKV
jgi:butyrate kinase